MCLPKPDKKWPFIHIWVSINQWCQNCMPRDLAYCLIGENHEEITSKMTNLLVFFDECERSRTMRILQILFFRLYRRRWWLSLGENLDDPLQLFRNSYLPKDFKSVSHFRRSHRIALKNFCLRQTSLLASRVVSGLVSGTRRCSSIWQWAYIRATAFRIRT